MRLDGSMKVGLAAEEDVPEGGMRCTHLGGPLCEGTLREFVVQCPWHGSRFDIRSGQVVGPPARSAVRMYPTTVEGGKVWVDLP